MVLKDRQPACLGKVRSLLSVMAWTGKCKDFAVCKSSRPGEAEAGLGVGVQPGLQTKISSEPTASFGTFEVESL